jgi:hypothetical protein
MMKMIRKIFTYVSVSFAADTPALREEASNAARDWMTAQGQGSYRWTDSYINQSQAFARAYVRTRCALLAREAVRSIH